MTQHTNASTRDDRFLDDIIAREAAAEARVRRAATLAWSVTFAMIPLLGILFFLSEVVEGMPLDVVRAVYLMLIMTGVLSLFLAILMTMAWLFRSRTPTLTAIQRRLAAIEATLASGGDR